MRKTDVEDLRAIVLQESPRPVFLLGAGASVTSGVPLVRTLIDQIGRFAYCRSNGLDMKDPNLLRSDWYPWVSSLDWFDQALEPQELYARHIEELLSPRERRRRFLQEQVVVGPDRASKGYQRLASLVGKRRIHSILTTNFDTLIFDSCRREPSASSVFQIQSAAQSGLISTDPAVSQIIHVHGVIEHYADLNLTEEVARLDPTYAQRIIPLIADHPLIVIGYGGAEPSVYRDLLLAAADAGPMALPHGIFWCTRPRDGGLHRNVVALAEHCRGNFAVVEIDGFDEVMAALDEDVSRVASSRPAPSLPFDGLIAATEFELDRGLVLRVLDDPALARLALAAPAGDGSTDNRLRLLNLLAPSGGGESLTNAAHLLFADSKPISVEVEVYQSVRTVTGNLFEVYDRLTDLVSASNEPYRLKGPESVDVRPFPPLAVKELLVNALAHRDYSTDEPIALSLDEQRLRVVNPGGLLEPDDLDDLGERPVRQYRNPAIAEVLYSAGLVDKYGSGLVDVRRWARDGGAVATFAIDDDNSHFEAVITSRPDSRSAEGVVSPDGAYEVFYVNALKVGLPDQIWVGATGAARPGDIYRHHDGERVPRFVLDGRSLYTFSDLSDRGNPLHQHVEAPELHDVDEVCSTRAGEAHIIDLLNRIFERHMGGDGIEVHHRKGRIWFHVNDDGSDREIDYRARMRSATRTVARQKGAQTRHPYFEHQAMAWSFVRTQGEWLLTIEPTWVFTVDGRSKLESRRRTTRLATKKMSNERNQAVVNHVFFWAWAICGEDDCVTLDDGSAAVLVDRTPLRRDAAGVLASRGSGEDDDPGPDDLEHIDDDAEQDDDDVDFSDGDDNR